MSFHSITESKWTFYKKSVYSNQDKHVSSRCTQLSQTHEFGLCKNNPIWVVSNNQRSRRDILFVKYLSYLFAKRRDRNNIQGILPGRGSQRQ